MVPLELNISLEHWQAHRRIFAVIGLLHLPSCDQAALANVEQELQVGASVRWWIIPKVCQAAAMTRFTHSPTCSCCHGGCLVLLQSKASAFPHAVAKKVFCFGHKFDGGQVCARHLVMMRRKKRDTWYYLISIGLRF